MATKKIEFYTERLNHIVSIAILDRIIFILLQVWKLYIICLKRAHVTQAITQQFNIRLRKGIYPTYPT